MVVVSNGDDWNRLQYILEVDSLRLVNGLNVVE